MQLLIKEMFDCGVDGIAFTPKNLNEIDLRGFDYNKKSKYDVYDLGNNFHIILYKIDKNGIIVEKEKFEAILTDPSVYIDHIIKCDFYGIISKKTKRSSSFVNELYKKIIVS